jgi:phage tail sheath protein FI
MPTYATPGVYFESVDQASSAIAAIRTDIAALVGIAQKGPLQRAVPVNSWEQFQSTFGTYLSNGYLAYAAKAFFENGGERMYGVRVAAPKASSNAAGVQPLDGASSVLASAEGFVGGAVATARQSLTRATVGIQPADRASSVLNSIAGFATGSVVHISQGATQAWHKVQAVDAVAQRLYWEAVLEPEFLLALPIAFTTAHAMDLAISSVNSATSTVTWNGSLTPMFDLSGAAPDIEFQTGACTSSGILYDNTGVATLEITATSPGGWGDGVGVVVSRSSLAGTSLMNVPQPPAGMSSLVQSVVGFVKFSVVKLYQATPPHTEYRKVTDVNVTTKSLTWDTTLLAHFDLANPLTNPISFETVEFGVTVYQNASAKETFAGLSLDSNHSRYVETVVNPLVPIKPPRVQTQIPSQYIRVKDLVSGTGYPNDLPDPAALRFTGGLLYLEGGHDGIAGLQVRDFVGDPASDKKWGIRAMEDVDEISIVAAPDILIEPSPAVSYSPLPPKKPNPCLPCVVGSLTVAPPALQPAEVAPQFSLNEIFYVQQALIAHCQLMQFRFAILDPPDFGYPKQRVDLGEVQSWRNRFDTTYAALYFPWILVRDPLQLGNQLVRRVPPSGHVAGVYANTDLTVGVFRAPANEVVQWAQDLTSEVTAEAQGFLNPLSVNCLRTFPGRGMRVYGARTLSDQSTWRFVNVRRLLFMIEHALEISMQWTVFEPNNNALRDLVRVSIESFLNVLWQKGALKGNTAEESFYVKCDDTNNPPDVSAKGQLVIEIGVAAAAPAEFIVFRLGKTEDTLEVTE